MNLVKTRIGLLALLVVLAPCIGAQAKKINVLFLSSFEAASPDTTTVLDSFRNGIAASGRQAEIFLQALDALRFPFTPAELDLYARSLAVRYRAVRLDIIIAQSDMAVEAAVRFRNAFAPGVPVYCFGQIDQDLVTRCAKEANVYGRVQGDPFPSTLRLAVRLFPKAKKAILLVTTGVVYTSSFNASLDAMREEFPALKFVPCVNTDYLAIEAILTAEGRDSFVILLPGGWTLPDGDFLSGGEMVDRLSSRFSVPFFGVQESSFGSGLVGGNLVDQVRMGNEASAMVLAILFGDAKPLPWLISTASVPTLDDRALRHFAVPPRFVPKEARVLFAPPGLWIRYEQPLKVLGLFIILALIVLFVMNIFRQRERRLLRASNRRLEETVASRTEALRTANAELAATNESLVESLRHIETMQQQLVDDTRDMVLGRVAIGLAHEINSPLAAIRASTYSMQAILQRDDDSLLGTLITLSKPQLDLFFRLLSLSRQEPSGPEAGDRSPEWRTGEDRLRAAVPGIAPETVTLILDAGLALLSEKDLRTIAAPRNGVILECLYRTGILENAVRITDAGATRIAETVETVRSYARDDATSGAGDQSSVAGTIDQAIFLLRNAIRQGISIRRRIDPDLPPVAVTSPHLVRVWANLVQNAIQAMPEGGEIEIIAHREGGYAVVEVVDSGPGVDPAIRDRLFTPLLTSDGTRMGMGLGLSICRRIVEGARGTIQYGERDGRTMFTVHIPLVETGHDN